MQIWVGSRAPYTCKVDLECGKVTGHTLRGAVLPTRKMDSKRVANQAILRSVNERISDLNESLAATLDLDPIFVCECSDLSCVTPITVALDDYRRVRENEKQFVVTPDHVEPEL